MTDIELTTMCAVIRDEKVLMLNRKKTWRGWAFPGGHLEAGESAVECVKRELYEEAGISLTDLHFKGITHFFNTTTGKRHIIFNYVSSDYKGTVANSCDEGEMAWVEISRLRDLAMAEGMEYRIPLFFEEKVQELYIEWNEESGYTRVVYQEG